MTRGHVTVGGAWPFFHARALPARARVQAPPVRALPVRARVYRAPAPPDVLPDRAVLRRPRAP